MNIRHQQYANVSGEPLPVGVAYDNIGSVDIPTQSKYICTVNWYLCVVYIQHSHLVHVQYLHVVHVQYSHLVHVQYLLVVHVLWVLSLHVGLYSDREEMHVLKRINSQGKCCVLCVIDGVPWTCQYSMFYQD